jgi:hypothetical protein
MKDVPFYLIVVEWDLYAATDSDQACDREYGERDGRFATYGCVCVWNLVRSGDHGSKDAFDWSGHMKIPHKGFANMGYLVKGFCSYQGSSFI